MPSGGARKHAGRPKKSLTQKTREIAEKASAQGITPLEVMINNMRHWYELGEYDRAGAAAKDAAPYMHPRLQTMTVQGDPTAPLTIQVVTGIPLPVEKKQPS